MNTKIANGVASFVFAIMLSDPILAQTCKYSDLPDPNCTPGVISSTNISEVCGKINGLTYSKRHRKTTEEMKSSVRQEYGKTSCGEIDHRLELSLGGADDVKNLWCQPSPKETAWNYKLKDKLEAFVWRNVCINHKIDLKTAQDIFLSPDWKVEYCKYIGGKPCQ